MEDSGDISQVFLADHQQAKNEGERNLLGLGASSSGSFNHFHPNNQVAPDKKSGAKEKSSAPGSILFSDNSGMVFRMLHNPVNHAVPDCGQPDIVRAVGLMILSISPYSFSKRLHVIICIAVRIVRSFHGQTSHTETRSRRSDFRLSNPLIHDQMEVSSRKCDQTSSLTTKLRKNHEKVIDADFPLRQLLISRLVLRLDEKTPVGSP